MTIHRFASEEILQIWESGLTQHPLDRALTLLLLIFPTQTRQALATLSIGQRDGHLLTLYEQAFGAWIVGQARCPTCQHRVEFNLNTHDIRMAPTEEESGELFTVTDTGYTVTFRLPNSLDLATIVHETDQAKARRRLIKQCMLEAIYNGNQIVVDSLPDVDFLPDKVLAAVATQMAVHDPQAEIELALTCPACGEGWPLLFDIVTFLWAKLDAHAHRLLREVNLLAQAYSWRESDILALSATRRQCYLEMVSS
ncbi:hypothetical protein BH10CHL1_BH10CHL1_42550 [soil metagenome]